MGIAITEQQVDFARTLVKWANQLNPIPAVRASEAEVSPGFGDVWAAVRELELTGLLVPSKQGGAGGDAVAAAIVAETLGFTMMPAGLIGAQVLGLIAGSHTNAAELLIASSRIAVAVENCLIEETSASQSMLLSGRCQLVVDAVDADYLLAGGPAGWWLLPVGEQVKIRPRIGPDLSRRFGSVEVKIAADNCFFLPGVGIDRVRRAIALIAAAEAAGIARWCTEAATEYAKTREQFGQKIGKFQAIKHLCVEMLELTESATAAAWDAATSWGEDDQQEQFASYVASSVALHNAVAVAKHCIQVHGGTGYTWEHNAQLYLRRALTLQAMIGDRDQAAGKLALLVAQGVRRVATVDYEGRDLPYRREAQRTAAHLASLSEKKQRAALVKSGYLVPHWPRPYGLGAGAVEQLVIEEELARVGVKQPDLFISGWALATIVGHGSELQNSRFLLPTLSGEIRWCQLFSEPDAGSDLAGLRTKATKVEGGWLISGQKVWTTMAHEAEWGFCLARSHQDLPKHQGITYFLIDMSAPGIQIRPLREMTGETSFNEVFLDNVFVSDDLVVGQPGEGWKLARVTLSNERVALAAMNFAPSLSQLVHMTATGVTPAQQMKVGLALAESAVCSALSRRTLIRSLVNQPAEPAFGERPGERPGERTRERPSAESSVAKLLGVASRQNSAELLLEMYQHRILVGDEKADEALLDMLMTRCLSIAGGTTQVLRNVVAEQLLGLPRDTTR